MNLVGVKCTLKDSSHDLGAKDTDLVEDLSDDKVREEVVGGGASDQDWWDVVSRERRLGHMVLRLDSCCEENENCKALELNCAQARNTCTILFVLHN